MSFDAQKQNATTAIPLDSKVNLATIKDLSLQTISFLITICIAGLSFLELQNQYNQMAKMLGFALILIQFLWVGKPALQAILKIKKNRFSRLPYLLSFILFLGLAFFSIFSAKPHFSSSFYIASASLILSSLFLLTSFERNIFEKAHSETAHLKAIDLPLVHAITDHQKIQDIHPKDLKIGDLFKVLPGEYIPRDGIIKDGTTSVEEDELIGEHNPLLKAKGDAVVGGSFNKDSEITVEVTHEYEKELLQIIKSKASDLVDSSSGITFVTIRSARIITLALSLLAVAAFFYHHLFLQVDLLTASVAPLALLTLIPINHPKLLSKSLRFFIGLCLKKGILVNTKKVFTHMSNLKSLFLTKTKTLTRGEYYFSQDCIETGNNMGTFLSTVFSLEKHSRHPIGKAMPTHPWYNEIPIHKVDNVKEFEGLGISGIIKPKHEKAYKACVGNLRFLKRNQFFISKELKNKIDDIEAMGDTVILAGYHKRIRGLISFSDILRKNAKDTLKQLQDLKIETCLLTGDTEKLITQSTGQLGLQKVFSRCLPNEKIEKIEKAKAQNKTVAVVGNKIKLFKDSKAIDVLISTHTGTDIKDHPADVIIMNSNFKSVSWLIKESKRLFLSVKQIQRWMMLYPLLFVIPSFLGYIHPVLTTLTSMLFSFISLNLLELTFELENQKNLD